MCDHFCVKKLAEVIESYPGLDLLPFLQNFEGKDSAYSTPSEWMDVGPTL